MISYTSFLNNSSENYITALVSGLTASISALRVGVCSIKASNTSSHSFLTYRRTVCRRKEKKHLIVNKKNTILDSFFFKYTNLSVHGLTWVFWTEVDRFHCQTDMTTSSPEHSWNRRSQVNIMYKHGTVRSKVAWHLLVLHFYSWSP